jgi:TolA-binding protein
MRPNYQDSFDAKHSTIDTEGAHRAMPQHRRRGSHSSSFSSKLDSVSETMPEDLNNETSPMVPISPRSPISEASPQSSEVAKSSDTSPKGSGDIGRQKPFVNRPSLANGSKLPKPKRPPLFKRRLRNKTTNNKDGISSTSSSDASNHNSKDNDSNTRPLSPTETSQTSQSTKGGLGAHTAPTASLSASISIERENSILPVLSGDEYEEDRRVHMPGSTRGSAAGSKVSEPSEEEKKEDVAESDLLLTEEGIEESSISPTVADQSIQSGGHQSLQSGSTAGAFSMNSAPAALQGRRIPSTGRRVPPSVSAFSPPKNSISLTRGSSGGSSPSSSGISVKSVPTPHKRYNRPIDKMESPARRPGTRNTVPVDLDEGAFLEAEHNLRAIHEMAAEHLAHGEYVEAIEVFEEILRGQQERYGQDHYRVGTALHNLGIVYLKKGDYRKAIEICGRAVSVRKEALVPNHPDVAVSLAQLGVAHLESHQFPKALEAFRDALHIRQNFLGPRHPKCSKILNNIGCALYSMEEFEEAKKAFEEALDIQRDTLRNLPSTEGSESNGMQSNALLLSSASTLCNIGSIRLRWGEFDEATIALEEALLVRR